MSIRPMGDNALIEIDSQARSEGGLWLPEHTPKYKARRPNSAAGGGSGLVWATVLAVGPGNRDHGAADFRAGERVLVKGDCGQDVTPGENASQAAGELGKELRLIRFAEALVASPALPE